MGDFLQYIRSFTDDAEALLEQDNSPDRLAVETNPGPSRDIQP